MGIINIALAQPDQIIAAQQFYDEQGYKGDAIKKDDRVVLAIDGLTIVGIARISWEDNFLCLRGMRISKAYQRAGLGTRLLKALEELIFLHDCYCLPYLHLGAFYSQIGFLPLENNQLPQLLKRRIFAYLEQGIAVMAMYRPARIETSIEI